MQVIGEMKLHMGRLRDHGLKQVAMVDVEKCLDEIERELEAEYAPLPKDADGVPIRVGDVMEGVDKYDSLKKVMGKVITVSFESDGITDVAIQVWNSDGKAWHRAYLDTNASVYRHYHKPTVESTLQKLLEQAVGYSDAHTTVALDAIAEYATKFRLADDEEED